MTISSYLPSLLSYISAQVISTTTSTPMKPNERKLPTPAMQLFKNQVGCLNTAPIKKMNACVNACLNACVNACYRGPRHY